MSFAAGFYVQFHPLYPEAHDGPCDGVRSFVRHHVEVLHERPQERKEHDDERG